jgi:hypothetical protein
MMYSNCKAEEFVKLFMPPSNSTAYDDILVGILPRVSLCLSLYHHYGALSTILALLESMALKGAVADGVWRSSMRSALGGWNGEWWP